MPASILVLITLKVDFATVSLYKTAMDNASYTWTNQVATATHELGHSIKMSHAGTNEGDNITALTSGQKSVMEQGKKDYWIQSYDISELKKIYP